MIDLRTLRPLDEETLLASVRGTSKCFILQEDIKTAGVASEVASILAEKVFVWFDAPIVRVAAPDTPVPLSPALEAAFLPDVPRVLEAERALAAY